MPSPLQRAVLFLSAWKWHDRRGRAGSFSAAVLFTDVLGHALVDSSTTPAYNIDPMAFGGQRGRLPIPPSGEISVATSPS